MTRILLHSDDPETVREVLLRHYPSLVLYTCTDYAGLPGAIAAFAPEVVYTCRFLPDPFPAEALFAAPSVRWVSNAGSGVNHFGRWDPTRVTVTNSAGVAAEAMANFALGAILHFALDIQGLIADQRAQMWRTRSVTPLAGRKLLLIGLGKTGQAMARAAAALGMRVEGVRANPRPTEHVARVWGPDELPEAMADADHILVCLPLTDLSRGLVGAEALAAVKPGAVLVDLSRGGIVDHDAMIEALDAGRLGGVALDVFPTEPLPAESPLWAREDVLISPHCSGVYDGWEARAVEMFAENLDRWRRGEPLENVVDPVAGY